MRTVKHTYIPYRIHESSITPILKLVGFNPRNSIISNLYFHVWYETIHIDEVLVIPVISNNDSVYHYGHRFGERKSEMKKRKGERKEQITDIHLTTSRKREREGEGERERLTT